MNSEDVKKVVKVEKSFNVPCLLIFFVFLALKLSNVITWSWVLVTAPLWVPLADIAAVINDMAKYNWKGSNVFSILLSKFQALKAVKAVEDGE